ncbi:MAG TPA: hypothetical protein V6C58_04040, partial [Allocoleopsis sp.]
MNIKRVLIIIISINVVFAIYKLGVFNKSIKGRNEIKFVNGKPQIDSLRIEEYPITAHPNIFEKA